jgi:nucleotide-binding universal stress UspA family protein
MRQSWTRILLATDFSPSSELALTQAARLAESLGAGLDLVHVHQIVVMPVPDTILAPPDDSAALAEAGRLLHELAARVGARVPVQVHLRTNEPVAGVLQLIGEIHPDLVVVGSHGRSAVMRVLLGSVADRLCRRSPVPVVVVPAPERSSVRLDPPEVAASNEAPLPA